MKKSILALDKYLFKVEIFAALLAGAIVMAMMLFVTADVIMRTFFEKPIQGTYDIVRFMFIGCVFMAAPYVQRIKGHINIEIVTDKLSPKVNRLFAVIGYLLAIYVVGILVWQTGLEARDTWIVQEYTMGILRVPLWPAKSVITLGMAMLLVRLVVDLVKEIAGNIEERG